MPSTPFNVVAFDLDGTLADTAPDIAAALNHALVSLARTPIPPEKVRNLIGHGARALIGRGLAATGGSSEELVERAYPIYLDYYAAHICVGSQPYPGVEAALSELEEAGLALAICTNKAEALARGLLEAFGWRGRFRSIIGGDTLEVRKPNPAPLREAIARAGGGRAAFVGDSIVDADTARAAGLPFVAVSFGFSDRPVEFLGADATIDSFDELLPTLRLL